MSEKIPSPAKEIRKKLEERNWIQADLAYVLGWSVGEVNTLLTERKNFTPEIAQELAVVFNTTPEFWLDINAKYELSKLDAVDDSLTRRSLLFNRFPAKEMLKRGWVKPSESLDELEQRFLNYFADNPKLHYAARKPGSYMDTTIEQEAWIRRAYQLAPAIMVKKFSDKAFLEAMDKLRLFLFDVENIRQIPKVLAEAGIRFLIIESLPSIKIEGITFWLDNLSPVIVLSFRYDRVDSFWHTLLHELSHVKNREGQDEPIIDVDLMNEEFTQKEKPDFEKRADKDAAEFSIPKDVLDSFIMRTHPSYLDKNILGFSALNKVHAGILVGQLHHRFHTTGKGVPFSHFRKYLVKVRNIITSDALTDGFGFEPSI